MNKSEELEYIIRQKLYEFIETPEIHSQSAEAFYIWQDNPESIIVYNDENDLDDEIFSKFLDWFIFDFKSFDNNQRLVELFIKKSADELNSQERLVLTDWSDSTRSYFEIKDINQGKNCVLSDLFSGNELLVHDSIVSNQLKITDIISARPVKTLDKYYFFSLVSVYPLVLKPEILEFFNKNYEAYKKEHEDSLTTSDFLKDFGYLIGNHLDEVINNPHYLTPDGEEFVIASSIYTLSNKSRAIEIINENDNFSLLNDVSDDLIIFRLDSLNNKKLDIHLELEEKQLIINANSLNTLSEVKIYLEKLIGPSLKHKKDISKSFNDFTSGSDKPNFKLPKGVRSKKQFNSQLDEYYGKWIDTPMEKLDGVSPRNAITTTEGRRKLEQILTELELLYEDARKAGEPYYDVNKLRDELQKSMN